MDIILSPIDEDAARVTLHYSGERLQLNGSRQRLGPARGRHTTPRRAALASHYGITTFKLPKLPTDTVAETRKQLEIDALEAALENIDWTIRQLRPQAGDRARHGHQPVVAREVLVKAPTKVSEVALTAEPFKQFVGPGAKFSARATLATLKLQGKDDPDSMPSEDVKRYPDLRKRKVKSKHRIVYSEDENNFFINGQKFDPRRLRRGDEALKEVNEWTINNDTTFWHTFHIHINDFQLIEVTASRCDGLRLRRQRLDPAGRQRDDALPADAVHRQVRLPLPRPRPRGQRDDGHRPRRRAVAPAASAHARMVDRVEDGRAFGPTTRLAASGIWCELLSRMCMR